MIYLIEDRDYLKIGYAEDVNKRIKQYKTHSLYPKLIKTKIGTVEDEKNLHQLCGQYWVSGEWFKNCPEILDIFNKYEPKLDLLQIKKITCYNLSLIFSCIKHNLKLSNPDNWYRIKPKSIPRTQEKLYWELKAHNSLIKEEEIWMKYYFNTHRVLNNYIQQAHWGMSHKDTIEFFFNWKVTFEYITNSDDWIIQINACYEYNTKEGNGD